MKRETVLEMVKEMKLPWAYYQFTEDTAQAPPFVVFFYGNNDGFFADNSNYADIEILSIELYTDTRDFDQEAAVEEILEKYGLTYTKQPAYIDKEKMWQISYESEVLING